MDNSISDLLSILEKQVKINEQLIQGKSGNLVDENIVKAPNSTFSDERSNLSTSEKKRTVEISSIFIKKFLEEQQKAKPDTKLQTSIKSSGSGMSDAVKNFQENPIQNSKSLWDKVKGWVVLGLGALATFWSKIKAALGKLGSAFKSLMSKIGGAVKKLMSRFLSAISKMWNSIKNSKIWKTLKSYISKAIKGIGKFFSSIRSRIGKLLSSISSGLKGFWKKITGSKVYKSFSKAISSSKKFIGEFFKKIRDKIARVVSSITKGIKSLVPGATAVASKAAESGKGFIGGIISKGKSIVGKGVEAAVSGAKSVASGARSVASGAKSVAKGAINMTKDAAKKVVTGAASKVIKSAGGMFNFMGRLTAKGAAKIPIIGPAIEAALATYDIKGMKEKLARGEISLPQLQQDAGRRIISGVTGMLGSAGGAVLAGALGSIVPVAGTALGAIVGGVGGDIAGRFLGGVVTDYIIPKKYTKTIGAFVTGTAPPQEEMQDFIIKGDKVYKFNSKDEVMGLKQGGAINEFLRGGAKTSLSIKLSPLSNRLLEIIAHNTTLMVNKIGGQSKSPTPILINHQSPQPTRSELLPVGNNREGYTNSPYSLSQ